MKHYILKSIQLAFVSILFFSNVSTAQINWQYAANYGSDLADGGRGVAVEPNGDYYVTGYFSDTIKFDTNTLISRGGTDIFVVKYATSGAVVWAVRAGSVNNDEGASVTIAKGDTIYVTGFFSGATNGNFGIALVGAGRDIFVHKLNKNTGVGYGAIAAGSNGNDEGMSIVFNKKTNGVYITGYLSNGCTFAGAAFAALASVGGTDIFAAGVSTFMTWNWANADGSAQNDEGHGICVNDSGCVYTTGFYAQNIQFDGGAVIATAGGRDMYVLQYNPGTGAIIRSYVAGSAANDEGNSITSTQAADLFVTGYHSNNINFGGGARACVGLNMYILRISNVFAWVNDINIGAAGNECGNSIFYDRWCNTVYVGGYYGNLTNFGGGARAAANQGAFVASYTPALAWNWDRTADGATNEQTTCITANGSTNVTATGFLSSTPAAFTSASVGPINLNTYGLNDVWCGEITRPGAGCAGGGAAAPVFVKLNIEEITNSKVVTIFPNPAIDVVNVTLTTEGALLTLTDMNGKIMMTKSVIAAENEKVQMDISHLTPGLYILTIDHKASMSVLKVIKQ